MRAVRIATYAWAVIAIMAGSDTGVSGAAAVLLTGSALGLAVAGLWVVAAGLRRGRGAPGNARVVAREYAPAALCLAGTLLAIAMLVPLKVRLFFCGPALQLSGPWMTQFSPTQLAASRPFVGSFRVREYSRHDLELRFVTSDCGGTATCGLVFSPGGQPPARAHESFRPLYGFWWHWRRE
jgi:hypothetical protein